jgi:hypothetical protein
MFRALLCPSSGAPSNCLCSLWLPYDCLVGRVLSCVRFTVVGTVCVGGALSRRHRSTCFGHCCALHQEPPPTAFAASGYRMIARLDMFQAVVGLLVRLQCVLAEWKKLHNAVHIVLYSLLTVVRVRKLRWMRWARHVARIGESIYLYTPPTHTVTSPVNRPQLETRPTWQSYGN